MKLFKKNKKGVFDVMASIAVGIAALAITLVVVFIIMGKVADNATVAADANATAAISEAQSAGDEIPGWLTIVVITAIGVLVLGMVRGLQGRR